MLQEITPKKFYCEYGEHLLDEESILLIFHGNDILISPDKESIFPTYGKMKEVLAGKASEISYLFSIDEKKYFLFEAWSDISHEKCLRADGYSYVKVRKLRDTVSHEDCFAAATGYHLHVWYRDHRYCGRCSGNLQKDKRERVLYCPSCGNTVYPRISPAVIVAVFNEDKILMTKYANREYKKYALIAGFCEIGEMAEDTVRREVMEEVGLRVKNIRYYKSQPWGFDSNLLLGYFAELDGADTITIEEAELAEAEWKYRHEVQGMDDGISLTREMIEVFAKGKEHSRFLDS
jgi:NAD+ diphosphatase